MRLRAPSSILAATVTAAALAGPAPVSAAALAPAPDSVKTTTVWGGAPVRHATPPGHLPDDTLTWSARIARARQQLLVVTPDRRSIQGRLYRYERGEGGWKRIGSPVEVVVGKSGVAAKREGDGRSPMGVFDLGPAFGYAPSPPEGLRIPYRALTADTRCVDDASSSHYARMVDSATVAHPDWTSAEKMRRDLAYGDDLYRWGVVVRYNHDQRPGAGSCIFLHVWRDASDPTVGCTAMPAPRLLEIMTWLRPEDDPVLVQGARADLQRLRGDGTLPFPLPD